MGDLSLLAPVDLARDLIGEISVITAIFVLRVVGVDVFARIGRLSRLVRVSWSALAHRRHHELVYTDADDAGMTTRRLVEALQAQRGSGVRVVALSTPEELLEWPLRSPWVGAVVLLVTDVSPLSSRSDVRDTIQERLVRFVGRGGTLVLGHDALYRRSRNHILQRLYGVTLTDFRPRREPVEYVRAARGDDGAVVDALLARLPDRLVLDDHEVVSGEWSSATSVLYRSEPASDGPAVPLVTYQPCGAGHAVWVNSGDHDRSGPPASVAKPQAALVTILATLLDGLARRDAGSTGAVTAGEGVEAPPDRTDVTAGSPSGA